MTINEIINHFDGVSKRGNGGYQARCPSHDDRHPSLSITDSPTGILLHCHTKECSFDDICRDAGLSPADLFHDEPKAKSVKAPF